MKNWRTLVCPHYYKIQFQILNAFTFGVFFSVFVTYTIGTSYKVLIIGLMSWFAYEILFWISAKDRPHLYSVYSRICIFILSYFASYIVKRIYN